MSPQGTNDFRILIDVAVHQKADVKRADEFVNRAAVLNPESAMVSFARGYLASKKGEPAQGYFENALKQEPVFPNARNNLGFCYAIMHEYGKARAEFEAAILTVGAPAKMQRAWLCNLGSAFLELDEKTKACEAWKGASEIATPGEEPQPRTFVGLAFCSYVEGRKVDAIDQYQRAIVLGWRNQLDLTKLQSFEQWRAGPKELQVAAAMIALASRTAPLK